MATRLQSAPPCLRHWTHIITLKFQGMLKWMYLLSERYSMSVFLPANFPNNITVRKCPTVIWNTKIKFHFITFVQWT